MIKTFVIGDIHGAYKALMQCLKRSAFDYQKDFLIVLGDVCDRWPEVDRCFDELLKIRHCVMIRGNHDAWALQWAKEGIQDKVWLNNGGQATLKSYPLVPMPKAHLEFLEKSVYFFEYQNRIFVHGGFDRERPILVQDENEFLWDRSLIQQAREIEVMDPYYQLSSYQEIYLGHTPTVNFGTDTPLRLCNVWDLDTGAGLGFKLSLMNIHTKQFWQSDATRVLYAR